MKKKTIFTLSAMVMIVPFLGFPDSWKNIVLLVLGLLIVGSAYREEIISFFSISTPSHGRIIQGESFVESTGPGKTS